VLLHEADVEKPANENSTKPTAMPVLYRGVENELACSITIPSCMVDDGELLRGAKMVEKLRSRQYTCSRSFVDERRSPDEV
jgi:hypothetical protein